MTQSQILNGVSSNTWSSAHNLAASASQVATMSGIGIAMTIFSIIGTILIGLSVLPQTIKTIRDHQTQQINILMYVFLVVGCAGLGIYGIGLVVVGNHIASNYFTNANLSYMISSTTLAPMTQTVNGEVVGSFSGSLSDYITPGQYHNLAVDYIVPGAMLIFGEFFASITSAIVLYYKVTNKMVAKKHNTTEDEVCKTFAKNHPSRLLPMFHHQPHSGGNK